jgi:2-polyprenyl-6-methoxyphenol hydroxylase-like FAD-dependent oxidoreductase
MNTVSTDLSALIVGGGIGGMSAAIALRRNGVSVALIDKDPDWRVAGAGITITGPTLRAFKQLGVFDEIAEQGYVGDGIRVCNVEGEFIADIPTPMPAEAGVPGSGGIARPVLHSILSRRTIAEGTTVRLGIEVASLVQDESGVSVVLSNGSAERYDLVVGADGVRSTTRAQIFPNAPMPRHTGQCTWRIFAKRPPNVDRRHYYLGGPAKVGFTPISSDMMYMFVNEKSQPKVLGQADLVEGLVALLDGYGGHIAQIRKSITPTTEIVVRPLEAFVLPMPWHMNRVVLIGDAAHPTTPQLSSGAGMAVEDAIVLAEEIQTASSVPDAFCDYAMRREERCRLVVDSSVAIGELEQAHAPAEQSTAIVERVLLKLSEPF